MKQDNLFLKEFNVENIEKEYNAIKNIPKCENGFENKYYNMNRNTFNKEVVTKLINNAKGLDLKTGYVTETYFFLWDNDTIVGLFKIRHYLTDTLKNGAGHVGFCILKNYRSLGYATKGLKLAIEKCKSIIKEDEIYLSVNKDNIASIKTQLKCGAYITGKTADKYFLRIRFNNNIHFGYRDLKRNDWKRLLKKETVIEDIKNEYFEGKVCLLKMLKVTSPLQVQSPIGDVIIANNNYKNLIFAPKNENWWLTIMFDNEDNIIESYFDITRLNSFEDDQNPFFIDMKLDICIPYNYEPSIMDEEDLQEILNNKMISKEDYEMAYSIANKIINEYSLNKNEYYKFVLNYYQKLNNNKKKE